MQLPSINPKTMINQLARIKELSNCNMQIQLKFPHSSTHNQELPRGFFHAEFIPSSAKNVINGLYVLQLAFLSVISCKLPNCQYPDTYSCFKLKSNYGCFEEMEKYRIHVSTSRMRMERSSLDNLLAKVSTA